MKLEVFCVVRPSTDNRYDLVYTCPNSFADNHRDAIARFLQDQEDYLLDGWSAAKKDGYAIALLTINTNDPTRISTTITYTIGSQKYSITSDTGQITSKTRAFI